MSDPTPLDYTVEVGFDWAGNPDVDPTWTDITAYVVEFSTRTGRRSALDKFDAGTATVLLDNSDGRFVPENTGSPYSPNVEPDKPLRISHPDGNVFVGFIDTWAPEFVAGDYQECVVTAADAFVHFAERDPVDLAPANARSSELTGVRAKALGAASASDNGLTTVAAKTYVDGSVLEALQGIEESEAGYLYVDPNVGNGMRPVFRSRHYRFLNDGSLERQYGLSDDVSTGDDVEVDRIETTFGKADKVDRVVVHTLTLGDVSQGSGPRRIERTIISDDTNEASSMAQYLLQTFGTYDLRVDGVTFPLGTGTHGADGWDGEAIVRGLSIGDRVRIRRSTDPNFDLIRDCWVEGIELDVKPGLIDGSCTLRLSPADQRTYWTLDYSALDSATRLAY